ncbi:MAG: hypothetical protein KAH44_17445, partial [Oricola sp.]|nr:hypothetical protein [Oricola sp.]
MIRNDLNQVNEDRMDLLLRSVDVLSDVIEAERTGSEPDDTSGLANDLETAFGLAEAAEEADDGDDALADFAPVMIDLADLGVAGTPAGRSFHISFAPHASLYLKGHDPLRFFRELADLGTLSVTCDTTDLPKLSELSPDESYLKWQIDLETESAREDIEAIFDWVDGECALSIEETGAPAADDGASLDAFLQSLDESDGGIADIDDFGQDPEMEPADAANPVADLIGSLEAADIGAPARQVEEQADAGNSDDGSEDAGARAGKKEVKKASQTIRVESEKVDRLINLMGELVINQAMLAERIGQAGFGNASPAALALVELQNLTREIQSGVMAIRAQPVKPVFMRMSRIIREVCSATGKKAMLEL